MASRSQFEPLQVSIVPPSRWPTPPTTPSANAAYSVASQRCAPPTAASRRRTPAPRADSPPRRGPGRRACRTAPRRRARARTPGNAQPGRLHPPGPPGALIDGNHQGLKHPSAREGTGIPARIKAPNHLVGDGVDQRASHDPGDDDHRVLRDVRRPPSPVANCGRSSSGTSSPPTSGHPTMLSTPCCTSPGWLAAAAEAADLDPDRISFTRVLRLVRRTATGTAAFPPQRWRDVLPDVLTTSPANSTHPP